MPERVGKQKAGPPNWEVQLRGQWEGARVVGAAAPRAAVAGPAPAAVPHPV